MLNIITYTNIVYIYLIFINILNHGSAMFLNLSWVFIKVSMSIVFVFFTQRTSLKKK